MRLTGAMVPSNFQASEPDWPRVPVSVAVSDKAAPVVPAVGAIMVVRVGVGRFTGPQEMRSCLCLRSRCLAVFEVAVPVLSSAQSTVVLVETLFPATVAPVMEAARWIPSAADAAMVLFSTVMAVETPVA